MTALDGVVRFFHDIDRRDWPAVRAGLADVVASDYTSLFGGEPEQVAADELVGRWAALLPGFDATQHLLGPIVPVASGAPGEYECNVHATHRLTGAEGHGDEWVVAGRYTLTVADDGRVAGIVLHASWESGDPTLAAVATERAAG